MKKGGPAESQVRIELKALPGKRHFPDAGQGLFTRGRVRVLEFSAAEISA
jgi:hypothetical protein